MENMEQSFFSPGWTGTVTHQTTEMSSAQFAAGHVFYKHFPLVVFLLLLTFIPSIEISIYRTSMVSQSFGLGDSDGPGDPSVQLAVRPTEH